IPPALLGEYETLQEVPAALLGVYEALQEVPAALLGVYEALQEVLWHSEAGPLATPVDPEADGLAHYRVLVAQPMDLGTVAARVVSGGYANPQEVREDVALVFKNCLLYNGDP
ncbi:Bromodomain-containing protein, partial [Baffinella frigidus]